MGLSFDTNPKHAGAEKDVDRVRARARETNKKGGRDKTRRKTETQREKTIISISSAMD